MEGVVKFGSSEHKCASSGDQGDSAGVVCGPSQEPDSQQASQCGDAKMDLPSKPTSSEAKLPPAGSNFQAKFEKLSPIQKTNICRLFPDLQKEISQSVKISQCPPEEDAVLDEDSAEELSDEEWSEEGDEDIPE